MKPRYVLKLFKHGKEVYSTNRASKRRLLSICKAKLASDYADKAFLEVKYNKTDSNTGFYNNFEEFLKAYEIFTEKALTDEYQTL